MVSTIQIYFLFWAGKRRNKHEIERDKLEPATFVVSGEDFCHALIILETSLQVCLCLFLATLSAWPWRKQSRFPWMWCWLCLLREKITYYSPSLSSSRYWGFFLEGKAVGAWSWPTTHLHLVLRLRNVWLYLHSPVCLHSIVLNWLSKGKTIKKSF
jgi:hypothetical protein